MRKILAATAVMALLVFGADGAVAQGKKDAVKIGAIYPTKTLIGKQGLAGAQLAADMINAAGGVLGGRPVEIVAYDTNYSPAEGTTVVQRLIDQDDVKIITGEIGSTVALAVMPIVEAEKGLLMFAVPKHPDVTKSGYDRLFRLNSTTAMDDKDFNEYLKQVNPQKVAVVGENSDFGRLNVETMKKLFGPKIVFSDFFGMNQSDFSALVTNLQGSGADLVCICSANMEQYGNILRLMGEVGYRPKRCLSPGTLNRDGVAIAGKAADGVFSADIYISNTSGNDLNRRFVDAHQAKYGAEPGKIEELGFETVWITAQALDKAGTADDTAKIAKAIRESVWTTPRGRVTFDPAGQATSGGLTFVQVADGKIIPF
ncbi:ABC transporter substrate-binding protein [Azospirillum endophyticum]